MITGSKISAFVLSAILLYLSVSANYGYFLPDNELLAGESKNLPACWYAEAPDLFIITGQVKKHLKSLKNLTVSGLMTIINDFSSSWQHSELSIANIGSGYISISKNIFYSLETRVIIFPFHFFG
jgi:hypothetical protein